MQVFFPADGVDSVPVRAGNIAEPGEGKGISKRLPVSIGLHINSVPVGLFAGRQASCDDFRKGPHGQGGFQHIPVVWIAVLVVACLHDFFPRQYILLSKHPVQFGLHLLKGESVKGGGEVAHQLIGVMADLPDVITVLVISGKIFFRIVNVLLQIGFQLAVIQVAVVDVGLIRQITGGDIGGLDPGQHCGTGG